MYTFNPPLPLLCFAFRFFSWFCVSCFVRQMPVAPLVYMLLLSHYAGGVGGGEGAA